jgi:DNA polymerase III alpha subunit (gram-positive type)
MFFGFEFPVCLTEIKENTTSVKYYNGNTMRKLCNGGKFITESFVAGCVAHGVNEKDALDIFDEMVGFAKYAFNKSHATAYGFLSYRTAYLKAHYPAEYFAALMTSVLSDTGKLGEYIIDAGRHGVKVLAPEINQSGVNFTVVDGNIRYGLLAIKNMGKNVSEAIRLYKEASDAGHASAQYNLGFCYWYGEGVAVDKEKAVELFRESARRGNARAEQMMRILNQHSFIRSSKEDI